MSFPPIGRTVGAAFASIALLVSAVVTGGAPADAAAGLPVIPAGSHVLLPASTAATLRQAVCVSGGPTAWDNALAHTLSPQINTPRMYGLNGSQISCARAIVRAVNAQRLPVRGAVIAITTAITESGLRNITEAVDHDSLGLYQQRPSQGWGTAAQVTNPAYATDSFLSVMRQMYPGGSWGSGDIGAICQAVQRSAYPDAYAAEVGAAAIITRAVLPPSLRTSFQANTGDLWTTGISGSWDSSLHMRSGTSPSLARLSNGGDEVAFQATDSRLWTTGTAGTKNWGLGMMAGTSPAIAALPGGGYQVAIQANTGRLWTAGTKGIRNTWLGMAGRTSPAITSLRSGGYQIAFQSNQHYLWTVGTAGGKAWHLGMRGATSPAITTLSNGGFQAAFQANTSRLWTAGSAGTANLRLGMQAGTSPGIAGLTTGGYKAVCQANTGRLWTAGTQGSRNTWLGMDTRTSPAVTTLANGGYQIAFQSNVHNLWTVGTAGNKRWGLGLHAATSPVIR